jgi:hypothetical protein
MIELAAEFRDAWLTRIYLSNLPGGCSKVEADNQACECLFIARAPEIDACPRHFGWNELECPGRKGPLIVAD